MARSGQASVEVVADFARFAASFQKDLNAALRGVTVNMDQISNQISAGVRTGVSAANREFQRLGPSAGAAFEGVARESSRAGQAMAAAFASAGRQMATVGDQLSMMISLPVAAAGATTIRTAGDFEAAMNRVRAVTESTGPAFIGLRDLAIELGAKTKFSATDAAFAMNELATAGFDTQQIMGALPGVLDMAAAGSIDLADAAGIASSILNGFGLAAKDLGAVNDILTRTSLSTATTMSTLGESFKYVGPTARSAGLSFTETAAAIGILGNAGIKGTMAGRALSTSIARLLRPTGAVAAKLNELGVSVTDSGGKMRSLTEIFRQLERAGADTSDMMTIFGLDAGPDMLALLSQGSGAISGLDAELKKAGGTAQRVAKIQMEGLKGSMEELRSAAEGLMIAIGDAGLLAVMTRIVKKIKDVVTSLSGTSPTFLRIASVVAVVVASIGPFLAITGRMIAMISSGIVVVRKFGALLVRLVPALSGMGGPIAWAVTGVIALATALTVAYQRSATFRNLVQQAMVVVGAAFTWLGGVAQQAMAWLSDRAASAGGAIAGLWRQAQPVLAAIGAAFQRVWQSAIRPALQGIGATLQQAGGVIAGFWTGTLQPVLAQIVGVFGRLAVAVRSWWAGNGDTVMQGAASVITWLGGVATTIFSGVMAVLSGVARVIAWVVTQVAIPLFRVLVSAWTTIIDVVMRLQPVWTILGAVIGVAIAAVIAVVKVLWSVLSVVFTAIIAIVRVLWSVIGVVFSAIGAIIQGFVGTITWLWGVIQPVIMAIAAVIATIAEALIWVWQNGIVPAGNGIVAAFTWLWGAIQTVVSAIASVVRTIIDAFIWVWGAIKTVVSAIASVVRTIADAFLWVWQNGIMPAINGIVAVVTWFGNVFGPIFSAIGNLIMTIWNGVISIVFDLFRLGFEILAAGAQVLWGILQAVFSAIGAGISVVWSAVVKPVLDAFGAAFTWLWGVIQPVVSAIGAAFSWLGGIAQGIINAIVGAFLWLWSGVQTVFSAIGAAFSWLGGIAQSVVNAIVGAFLWLWSGIQTIGALIGAIFTLMGSVVQMVIDAIIAGFMWLWNTAVSIFNGIVNAVRNAISGVEQGAAGFANFVNNVSSYFQSLVDAVRSRINSIIDTVRNLPGSILNAIGNLGNLLYNAGSNIISGLINGFTSRLGELRSTISSAASSIRDFFPFSPAKTGPLSGSGDPTIAGAKIITMLASGIDDAIPTLQAMADQAAAVALSTITPELLPMPTLALPATPRAEQGPATTQPTTIYLTVQSLDPRQSATLVMDAIRTYESANGTRWRR